MCAVDGVEPIHNRPNVGASKLLGDCDRSFFEISSAGDSSQNSTLWIEFVSRIEDPRVISPLSNLERVKMLAKGDGVVVPAILGNFRVRPQWDIKFLKSSVPGIRLPEPETRM